MSPSYANAAAFRQALETRIRTVAEERGVQIQGLRLKVAIERLLARLFHGSDPPWLLKGGYAMELRFRPRARTTRDVDLTIGDVVPPDALASKLVEVHERLMTAAAQHLGDFFEFTIPPARGELTAAPGAQGGRARGSRSAAAVTAAGPSCTGRAAGWARATSRRCWASTRPRLCLVGPGPRGGRRSVAR